MGFDMFDFARVIARAGIRHAEPDLTDIEVEQRLFVRFYGRDLPPERVADIVERIGRGELGPGSTAEGRRRQ